MGWFLLRYDHVGLGQVRISFIGFQLNTDDEDGETGFIVETHTDALFSDDDDDDDNDNDNDEIDHRGRRDDDDDLLPWDDDLLTLE